MGSVKIRTADEVKALEEKYQITFSPHERMLLTTDRKLLLPLETQEQYILGMDLIQVKCPACLSAICKRSADPGAKDGTDFRGSTADDAHKCPRCGARLVYWIELIGGGQGFDIHKDEARPVIS